MKSELHRATACRSRTNTNNTSAFKINQWYVDWYVES